MRKAIYTAIIDDYDEVKIPNFINADWDYILFTNQDIESDFWTVIKVEGSGVKLARHIKIMSHNYLPEYDLTVWLDGNIIQNCDMDEFTQQIDNYDMITMKHPSRDCIYQEVEACLHYKKDKLSRMNAQVDRYKAEGYPARNGMIGSGILIRKRNTRVVQLMKLWNKEVQEYSHRDQLSFNYCLSKIPLALGLVPFSVLYSHFQKPAHK